MTPCVWRILCLRNSSSVPYMYFRQPPNLPTAARRNRKCTECGTTTFGRNRMSAESAHLSTFGAETEAEIRSTSKFALTIFGANARLDARTNEQAIITEQNHKNRRYFRFSFRSADENHRTPTPIHRHQSSDEDIHASGLSI